jgi:hypothetical protein
MRTGRCQCSEVCYESMEESISLYVCHCRECQKQSASAFGITLEVPRKGFRVTQGTPTYWSRATDSGRELKCVFCPTCGSRLWHEAESTSETLSIKGSSLDNNLSRWILQAQSSSNKGTSKLTAEQAELNKLRQEIKRLKMEREILKKAAAFFASESS